MNDCGIAHVKDIRVRPAITRNRLLVGGARKALDIIAPERPQAGEAPQWLYRRVERHEIAVRQHRTISCGGRLGLNARDLVASSGPRARHESEQHIAHSATGKLRRLPLRVVCHEHRHEYRWCATVREMKEGPSGSTIRC